MKKDYLIYIIALMIIIVIAIPLGIIIPNKMLKNNKLHTVTFMDIDGVYRVEDNVKEGTKISEPTPPTKSGYDFLGWYIDSEKYNFDKPITEDIYLKAKWLNSNTNKIELINDEQEKEIKDNSDIKSNVNDNNSSTNTNNNNSTNTNTNKSSKSSKVEEIPKGSYTVVVKNGSGSGIYKNGEKVTITANVPGESISDWQGQTSEADGNVRYKVKTTYSFKQWNDGDTNLTRTITVTKNANYEPQFNVSTEQIDNQTYKLVKKPVYDYPNRIRFDFNMSDGKYYANGSLEKGISNICVKGKKCVFYAMGTVIGGPTPSITTIDWKFSSTGSQWNIEYNYSTGTINITGGNKVDSKRTAKLHLIYTEDETVGLVDIPDKASPYFTHYANIINNCPQGNCPKLTSYLYKDVEETTKNPINLTVNVDKVITSYTDSYEWVNN